MSIDVNALWDHGNPELSESRFRAALKDAEPDDQLILTTQIARTFGKRKEFEVAREILATIEPKLGEASDETKVRYWLELGRSHCSTAHAPDLRTEDAKALARDAYLRAFEAAKGARLDNLAIDALHMMTTVDESPDDQIEWNRKAIDYMDTSDQPEAKKWEGSLLNNLGYALQLAGRYEEALFEFQQSLAVREVAGNIGGTRVAHWMIANTLRLMGRFEEALEIQLRLEKEYEDAGEVDSYVFEELEQLYRALENPDRAQFYADKLKA